MVVLDDYNELNSVIDCDILVHVLVEVINQLENSPNQVETYNKVSI